MKIALAQLNQIVGDIAGNTKRIISIIKKTKVDIIVFPELAVTGYIPQDLLLKPSFVEGNFNALKKIARYTKHKSAIIGFIEWACENLYNSAAIICNQQIIGIHHKICLPNYAIFDENSKIWKLKYRKTESKKITNNIYFFECYLNIRIDGELIGQISCSRLE